MTEGEKSRLVAWNQEIHRAHARLREALAVVREELDSAAVEKAGRDLLLFCRGFCTALTGHHEGEDRELFPAIAADHPELRGTLRALEQDHSMIGYLLSDMRVAMNRDASPAELERHLEGIGAIMESHFRFEERKLMSVLEELALDADPDEVLGNL
ncbi:hemerythrin domain-containing protein [Saccharopolyspora sp. TS4A08]|uniref:Hemerythrin domain-containing protein n=1 Tax=Saccharopolyspora ipomoeae TaxID=3042027 RepID=A0ABT6PJS3_9PSEU|nr:hemerythrin domain-containing protein [Saccharopolyspora sp. TS4A08]MDI2028247.1 hemerythrin domain-containing protein [Saccharopolyspora sp. TS4A08]